MFHNIILLYRQERIGNIILGMLKVSLSWKHSQISKIDIAIVGMIILLECINIPLVDF